MTDNILFIQSRSLHDKRCEGDQKCEMHQLSPNAMCFCVSVCGLCVALLGPYGGQRQTCHSMNHGLGLRACCETLRGKCSVNRE